MKRNKETLKIKSDNSNILAVQNFIEEICDRYNMYNYFGTLSMAVLEAVENAIRHGNKGNNEKMVHIDFCWRNENIQFSIQDEGDGFNFKQFQDLPDESGAGDGIFLMRSLSNEINFEGNGSTVVLTFYVNGIDVEKSVSRNLAFEKFFESHKIKAPDMK